ncbi:PREDICTED: WD repeat and HMG-box DNA-binding protein 1 [Dufourea novaeangliae]|uniref:WD repeat and HMG-box DNA-binding protein 1 n=1 Tax=Dufourea novaeangliae TaxID=178035 RepID=A0A154P6V5_DUFNO|nr:PREDICTED: WD repeat and HMG-box DNA-binding protein 1 [Dufourea novaeangliae]KZC07659.1 WD repeat and HMG-box DNA-binding protein 1 [Dufourea novaeangliae]
MPLIKKPMRYAHPEGHTDVCYFTGEKKGLVTCGSDGDVRSWLNLMDDDPAASCVADQAISVISKNGKIFVGNDNNTVQILNYPDLEKEGIVTRFSAPVSALATTKNSNIIVSGSCDMRIQVTDINTSDNTELLGHEAPILGLSLDPKEEFVASSSADGSVRVWNIKEKRVANIWNNIVPKCNSFFTSKVYCVPSFQGKDGSCLAYPHMKDVVVVERSSWKELFHLKCINIKTEISICKFSECGTLLAASTINGEIIVWDVKTKDLIGYIENQQNAKITSLSWNIDAPDEIAFCDHLGQLGCIDVILCEKLSSNEDNVEINGHVEDNDICLPDEEDDDGENVISLDKIKRSVDLEEDQKSCSEEETVKSQHDTNVFAPEINLQPPFQPGSSPVHLLSRFMVWNDTGMVRCFTSEDGDESSIEIEFHDATIHRSMHINNYLRHTVATLSPYALALNCPSNSDTRSKLVVIVLQGWGSGNKEWSVDLPEDEEGQCVAAGDTFVALATSKRNLRIFTVGGTQREIISLPGPVVAMNGLRNTVVIAYHSGIGALGDQNMSLLWIQIRGLTLHSKKLSLPLSPSSELMWLGLTDIGSPAVMDADDVIRVYNKKSSLWKVASDLNGQTKGKADHYFIIGINEQESIARCVLCKGSYYPPTTPRPVITELSLIPPLCEPESEKSDKEFKLWKLGGDSSEVNEAVLALFALACRSNLEYRAVELCEQIASEKVIELAVKYARRINRTALSNKLESIADKRDEENKKEQETENKDNDIDEGKSDDEVQNNEIEEPTISLSVQKKPEVEIKPLSMSEALSLKRSNPFLKSGNSLATKGLAGLDITPEKPQKLSVSTPAPSKSKAKEAKAGAKKETFISWYAKNKKSLQEEFPELSPADLTKTALSRYKEIGATPTSNVPPESTDTKKRKLSSEDEQNKPKRVANKILSTFAFG